MQNVAKFVKPYSSKSPSEIPTATKGNSLGFKTENTIKAVI
jgi:hypothetical protein